MLALVRSSHSPAPALYEVTSCELIRSMPPHSDYTVVLLMDDGFPINVYNMTIACYRELLESFCTSGFADFTSWPCECGS